MEYHNLKIDKVFDELDTSSKGLTEKEAKKRLQEQGPNELAEGEKIHPFMIFIDQFKSFVILILFAVMVVSIILQDWLEAGAVFAILILNGFFGFIQEYKAEKAIEALKKMATPKAKVIRNGEEKEIDSTQIVPGDIISLAAGDKVPADARIIEEMVLETQEAALTGESLPCRKSHDKLNKNTPLATRTNMVYSGTTVTKGHGKAVVVATGMNTEFGKIAEVIQKTPEEPTHLQVKLKELGHSLGILTIVICFAIFGVGLLAGHDLIEILETSIALAVAAIPEGLAAVVTISLALGVQRMVKRNALMRKLTSVETLGSTTVICTDKTGTLTHNQMTVKKLYVNDEVVSVSGSGYSPKGEFSSDPRNFEMLLKIGALNNDAKLHGEENYKVIGDPTEGCLLVSAMKAGMDLKKLNKKHKRTDEVPFDSERKLMTTVHGDLVLTKGAPDNLVEICDRILINGTVERMTRAKKKKILEANHKFAQQALRVLGFAYKEKSEDYEKNLIFVGLQAMIDPPREEVKESIDKCKTAGIKVMMVTGDSKDTAVAIGRELGITGIALTGAELEKMDDLDEKIEDIGIFARVNPSHKSMIVEALKKKGHVVAMTGDGVNDAPALKKADIGVAMGITGTDVAKEASDVVLTDDNFKSIVNAVEEGRGIYDNIKKFVQYLLSCNIGEVLTVFLAVILGSLMQNASPLLPLQILLMNILTDSLPALALGIEPIEKGIMKRKPRKPDEKIFSKSIMVNMFFVGIIMALGTLVIFWQYLPKGIQYAQTMAFTTLVMFQMFNVLNSKSEKKSLFEVGVFSNKYLIGAIVSSVALQLAILYTPLNQVFDTVSITLQDWAIILVASASIIVLMEIYKITKR